MRSLSRNVFGIMLVIQSLAFAKNCELTQVVEGELLRNDKLEIYLTLNKGTHQQLIVPVLSDNVDIKKCSVQFCKARFEVKFSETPKMNLKSLVVSQIKIIKRLENTFPKAFIGCRLY